MYHPFQKAIGPYALICDFNSPTFKYWLGGYIEKNSINVTFLSPNKSPNTYILDCFNTFIFVRFIPNKWKNFLKKSTKNKILIIDDDLLSLTSLKDLPLNYSYKLFWNITIYSFRLEKLINEIWVTSKNLQKKYDYKYSKEKLTCKLIPISPSKDIIVKKKYYRVAYLGTSSHKKELFWLKKLFEKMQSQRDDCILEIVANRYWRNIFRHIPRCRIFYPMDFNTFLSDTSNRNIDLLLVPLLSSKFNDCRSPVKFFDAARLNAAGIYSAREPYLNFINHNIDGILLNNDQSKWLYTINYLLDNEYKLENLKIRCKKRVIEYL